MSWKQKLMSSFRAVNCDNRKDTDAVDLALTRDTSYCFPWVHFMKHCARVEDVSSSCSLVTLQIGITYEALQTAGHSAEVLIIFMASRNQYM